jgi:hypothetical protein
MLVTADPTWMKSHHSTIFVTIGTLLVPSREEGMNDGDQSG